MITKKTKNSMKRKLSSLVLFIALTMTSVFATSTVITLDLSQPTNPSVFETDNGFWIETFNDVDYTFIKFNNNIFSLSHLIGGEGASYGGFYWDGFTYSQSGDNTDHSGNWYGVNEWGNMAGGGIKTDAEGNVLTEAGVVLTDPEIPYLVAHWGYFEVVQPVQVFLDNVYEAVGIYVNNSPLPYYGNITGDDFSRALEQDGDYFKLIIHGLDENNEDTGKSVEHFLAVNEGGTLFQSRNWEWVDLSALGKIGGVYFTMESTDSSPWGMNTAAYFCMDKLQVRTSETKNQSLVADAQISVYPNPFTDYIVIEAVAVGKATIYDLSGKAVLTENIESGSNRLSVSALAKGSYVLKVGENAVKIVK